MIHSGEKAVVLGLGGSGEAAARLLLEEGAVVTVCDSGTSESIRARALALESSGIASKLGSDADDDENQYDICVISPGIDPETPLVRNIVRKGIPIISEVELAFQECSCPVIAITGTNGKTTTTELTTTILSGSGLRTVACGNIGLPFSTAVRESHELDVIVLEVSSFQLEAVAQFRAHVAVWLNFSPNHLDRYADVDAYRAAKLRIFERQTADDFAIVNADGQLPTLIAQVLTFSATDANADFHFDGRFIRFHGMPIIDFSSTKLTGVHNAENLMAAFAIGHVLDVELDKLAAAALQYIPPAHRCERVRELDGAIWINDSKATTLDAMEKAILSQDRPIILIAGGKNKGFGFEPIIDVIRRRVKRVVLIGEMRNRIAVDWAGVECRCCDSLDEAVVAAREMASSGDAIVFSPGTSSFDMFKSYIERGECFKSLVNAL